MNTVRTALLGVAVSLTLAMNAGAITDFETTIAEIVQNPDKFNQMEVSVRGRAVEIQQRMTQEGSLQTIFSLVSLRSGDKLDVEYTPGAVNPPGTLKLQESALVTVQGVFYKRPTKTGFTNVIQAIFVQ
jgi:hypothetical protein